MSIPEKKMLNGLFSDDRLSELMGRLGKTILGSGPGSDRPVPQDTPPARPENWPMLSFKDMDSYGSGQKEPRDMERDVVGYDAVFQYKLMDLPSHPRRGQPPDARQTGDEAGQRYYAALDSDARPPDAMRTVKSEPDGYVPTTKVSEARFREAEKRMAEEKVRMMEKNYSIENLEEKDRKFYDGQRAEGLVNHPVVARQIKSLLDATNEEMRKNGKALESGGYFFVNEKDKNDIIFIPMKDEEPEKHVYKSGMTWKMMDDNIKIDDKQYVKLANIHVHPRDENIIASQTDNMPGILGGVERPMIIIEGNQAFISMDKLDAFDNEGNSFTFKKEKVNNEDRYIWGPDSHSSNDKIGPFASPIPKSLDVYERQWIESEKKVKKR